MKVLLIQSSLGGRSDFILFPIGLAALAATLEAHEVRGLDLNVVDDPEVCLKEIFRDFTPDAVGISLRNIDNQTPDPFDYYYRTCFQKELLLIRKVFGDLIPVIAGGSGFSLFAAQIMHENPSITIGAPLEGESLFPELLDSLDDPGRVKGIYYRVGSEVVFTGKRLFPDVAALPTPRYDLFDLNRYSPLVGVGIQTSRGCINRCSYCVYPNLCGGTLRNRSPEVIVDEIESLVRTYGITKFFFIDSSFGMSRRFGRSVLEEMIDRQLDVEWGAYFDMLCDESFLLLARKAGCTNFIFSPDGYTARALKRFGKGFGPGHVKKHIGLMQSHQAFKGCFLCYTFLKSPPGETLAGYLRTLSAVWLIRLKSRLRLTNTVNVFLFWLRIEPGTGISALAEQEGRILSERELLPPEGSDYSRLFYRNPGLRPVEEILSRALGLFKRIRP